ncbi:type I methionyl aminopeptidase [Helicobacter kayseriensis]|uniref:type I methionyl aminopeptidase n=1 Tax=Helicobacter kayseriensis TaxID=2905877 RepID=UPI001E5ED024|nr:type I methionyl aminopeptidase [Helicobacter kayseriensis]MCE3047318.1 type I methionyl aminopeptidase [Helicobacter kayseriensis]MCE3048689.1 type I methionyl aminopeptidase [Helicobacter kayseriensis]
MAITIKKANEIDLLRTSNLIVAQALEKAKKIAKAGVSLLEIDQTIEEHILSSGARPAFKGLYGFPNSACISVNAVAIHGIPTEYKLQDGDIVGIDVGVEKDGWYGDSAITIGIGKIAIEDQKLIAASEQVLLEAISSLQEGMHFKELSLLLGDLIGEYGFVPLLDYCGHGIGRKPHEEPQIPNYLLHGKAKSGEKIKNGMVFCIEPMICQKSGKPVVLKDGWSVVSEDGLNTSHHEHTVAIIGGKAEILSKE